MAENLVQTVQDMLKEEAWTRATISNYTQNELKDLANIVEQARNENCVDEILEILSDVNEDVDFANEKALVDEGLIDSYDITSIITALDEKYDIRIKASEIEPENFNSIEAIVETVERYLERR